MKIKVIKAIDNEPVIMNLMGKFLNLNLLQMFLGML